MVLDDYQGTPLTQLTAQRSAAKDGIVMDAFLDAIADVKTSLIVCTTIRLLAQ